MAVRRSNKLKSSSLEKLREFHARIAPKKQSHGQISFIEKPLELPTRIGNEGELPGVVAPPGPDPVHAGLLQVPLHQAHPPVVHAHPPVHVSDNRNKHCK
jgi:hypothetical protein